MKRFTVPCDFAGEKCDFHIYIGRPSTLSGSLWYQTSWLKQERGGEVPQDVIDSFSTLRDIAEENDTNYEELCVYALGEASKKDTKKITPIKKKEGNVLIVNFKKAAKKATKSKKAEGNHYNFGSFKFFNSILLDDAKALLFCNEFAALLIPSNINKPAEYQSGQFAQQLLAAIFMLIIRSGAGTDKKKGKSIWVNKLEGYLGYPEKEQGYNLAVSADVLGEFLTFTDIATLDYFLRCDESWKHYITEKIHNAITRWADKKTMPQDIFRLGKFGADEKAIATLKKTLKTSFHPL